MARERDTATGTFTSAGTLDDVLAVFDAVDGPVILSADVADALDVSRQTARRKLEQLHERGDVERRRVSKRMLYWRRDDETGDTGASAVEAPGEAANTAREPQGSDAEDGLDGVDFPGNKSREACVAAVTAAANVVRERGGATKAEIVSTVMPEHPLGYDSENAVAKVEGDERYRGGWWRRIVKPGLIALDTVEKPPRGASTWTPADGPTGGGQ